VFTKVTTDRRCFFRWRARLAAEYGG